MPSIAKTWTIPRLQALLAAVGAGKAGVKAELWTRLQEAARTPLLPPASASGNGRTRLLSVDMGIRNLAYCLVEVQSGASGGQSRLSAPTNVRVLRWKKVALLPAAPPKSASSTIPTRQETTTEPSAAYHPANLSVVATDLITSTFLPLAPHTILLERQRFRTGGASAVQEWTLRVNMLESMLWAALRMLAHRHDAGGDVGGAGNAAVHGVLPARVAAAFPLDDKRAAPVDNKRAKVALVRSWLTEASRPPNICLSVTDSDGARDARDAFLSREAGVRLQGGKLDDLADCLLQAVAWIYWDANRRLLREQGIDGLATEIHR